MDPDYTGGHAIASFRSATDDEGRLPSDVEARAFLIEALEAMESGAAKTAFDAATNSLVIEPDNLFALLVQGAAAWSLDDFESAMAISRQARKIAPLAPLPHILYVSAFSQKQDCKKLELASIDYHQKFKALATPEVPGIEGVFVNFDSLTQEQRKVVLISVAPFAKFLSKLEKEGVSHYILPLYRHLTDVQGMTPWKNQPTFDGRNYDGVRGAAGKIAVSGIETIWPTTRMGMNTIAHEFAHQVHRHALRGADKSEIERLYNKAKKSGRCLDFYAAENDQEYFAQGFEAYVSPMKRPTSSETAKNTREDLIRKDPELFEFIRGLEKR